MMIDDEFPETRITPRDFWGQSARVETQTRLESNLVYKHTGSNGQLQIIPEVVTFEGFELGATLKKTVRVVNTSSKPCRMHFFGTETPLFVSKFAKKGAIAPGVAELIEISFTPEELKQAHDSVKIHSEAGNLVIPITATPGTRSLRIPKILDFGEIPIASTQHRKIVLHGDTMNEYSFHIDLNDVPDVFEVEPTSGTVPVGGSVTIVASFTPVNYVVSRGTFQCIIDDKERHVCNIIGNAAPGKIKDEHMVKGKEKINKKISEFDSEKPNSGTKLPGLVKDRSVAPATQRVENRGTNFKTLIKQTSSEIVDGIEIPITLDSQQNVNKILMREKGKMNAHELHAAIQAKRQRQELERKEQELQQQKISISQDPVDKILQDESIFCDESTSYKVRKSLFNERVQKENPTSKVISVPRTGSVIMTSDQLERIQEARSVSIREEAKNLRHARREDFTGSRSKEMRVVVPLSECNDRDIPSFSVYSNNQAWGMRIRALERLIATVSMVIIRQRADRRIKAIWKKLGAANSKDEVRAIVEEDARLSNIGVDTSAKKSPEAKQELIKYKHYLMSKCGNRETKSAGGARISDAMTSIPVTVTDLLNEPIEDAKYVQLITFPREETAAFSIKPIVGGLAKGFQDLTLLKLRQPEEAKLNGYTEIPLTHISRYVPKLDHLVFMESSNMESNWRSISQSSTEITEAHFETQIARNHMMPQLEYLTSKVTSPVLVNVEKVNESQPEYYLRNLSAEGLVPEAFESLQRNIVGVASLKVIEVEPTISSIWRARQTPYGGVGKMWNTRNTFSKLMNKGVEDDAISYGDDDDDDENDTNAAPIITLSKARTFFAPITDENDGANVKIAESHNESLHRSKLHVIVMEQRQQRLLLLQNTIASCVDQIAHPSLKFDPNIVK